MCGPGRGAVPLPRLITGRCSTLEEACVVSFLRRRNLVTPADIVSGELRIENVSRRNRNFKVTRNGAPGYLLKQGVGDERRRTVAHEASAYSALSSLDGPAAVLPRFYGFDEQDCVLIVGLLEDGQSLAEYHRDSGFGNERVTRNPIPYRSEH